METIKIGELKHYECSLDGLHWESINATSSGKAKTTYSRGFDFDFKFTDIRCRVIGSPYTSPEFVKNAKYRNIEFAYCGMVVMVDDMAGVIVGHNNSANLDVLFTADKHKGQTLNCHPNHKMKYFDKKGILIKEF